MKKLSKKAQDEQLILKNRILSQIQPSLSDEQKHFIDVALEGHNILVDACIGSGKTTSIQALCNIISTDHNILYLTYNKLLKFDAKDKIKNKNVTVTNYHGFVYPYLRRANVNTGVSESIRAFVNLKPKIKHYDIMIIDEYQDINQECAELIEYIKSTNSEMQIIAVGDMHQKIYDFTTLDVELWIHNFLGNFKSISFTKCFRIGNALASNLAYAWNKPISGVNKKQIVRTMKMRDVVDYLLSKEPQDILSLGYRYSKFSIGY